MNRIAIPAEQLPANGERCMLKVEGKDLALFNVEETLYAIDDSCPHQGASLLGGNLQGRMIQCRAHGLCFDLATGCMANVNKFGLVSYPLEIIDGQTFVLFPDSPSQEPAR